MKSLRDKDSKGVVFANFHYLAGERKRDKRGLSSALSQGHFQVNYRRRGEKTSIYRRSSRARTLKKCLVPQTAEGDLPKSRALCSSRISLWDARHDYRPSSRRDDRLKRYSRF